LRSSEADFIAVAADFLCPVDRKHHGECMQVLQRSLQAGASETYSPFQGNTIACDFQKCQVSWKCQYDANGNAIHGSCSVFAPANREPKTMVQELKRYVSGFRALR
jgi:hypothetical protein